MLSYPNVLLIAGTGRNAGKTTLACAIINRISRKSSVYAVKISPHLHHKISSSELIYNGENFLIYEEKKSTHQKDSSRMLAAGAFKSFYIESADQQVMQAFETLHSLIPKNSPIVCESPALRTFMEPGIFIITDNEKVVSRKKKVIQQMPFAHLVVKSLPDGPESLISQFSFEDGKWNMKSV